MTLSEAFWEEIRTHPVPVDAEVVRALAHHPGCLDLYTWLSWRCYQARAGERIPLFGSLGLASQLGVQEYDRERKFRERVRRWLAVVKVYWPECPARVSADGQCLELGPAVALRYGPLSSHVPDLLLLGHRPCDCACPRCAQPGSGEISTSLKNAAVSRKRLPRAPRAVLK